MHVAVRGEREEQLASRLRPRWMSFPRNARVIALGRDARDDAGLPGAACSPLDLRPISDVPLGGSTGAATRKDETINFFWGFVVRLPSF